MQPFLTSQYHVTQAKLMPHCLSMEIYGRWSRHGCKPDISSNCITGSVSRDDGSTVALVLLMIIVIAWFVLENFVWEKYCSHTFTIYPVFILALSALIDKLWLWTDVKRNLVIACVDLAIVLTVFIARIILSVTRWKKRTGASSTTTTSVPLEGLG